MSLDPLNAISPVDGRYAGKTAPLNQYFSEAALIRYRVQIEVEYFIALCEEQTGRMKDMDPKHFKELRTIYENFSEADARKVKSIEKSINHDVKAVEYFVKEKLDQMGLSDYKEYVHLGLTSQDVNNTAVPLSLKESWTREMEPLMHQMLQLLEEKAQQWMNIPMLAHTHGQPASPTKLGKEIKVFAHRMEKQLKPLKSFPFSGKFGGATGNFNAHQAAFPNTNWEKFGHKLLKEQLGLVRQQYTTQIEHYDDMAAFFAAIQRINTILTDYARDMWTYISMEYFKQQIIAGEVGSSAMPHKVNPIDFENAEGNLGIANAMFIHLQQELPLSRLQRDLTDSTVTRNMGVPLAHTMIAIKALIKGTKKLLANEDKIKQDLENNWAVVAEAIQTILRREGVENPYEKLKELTRTGEKITREKIQAFIQNLNVNENVKEELMKINPQNYTGIY